jgi:hypothetical protein
MKVKWTRLITVMFVAVCVATPVTSAYSDRAGSMNRGRSFSDGSRSSGRESRSLDRGSRSFGGESRSFDRGSRSFGGESRSFDRGSRSFGQGGGTRNFGGGRDSFRSFNRGGFRDFDRDDRFRNFRHRDNDSLRFFFGFGYPFGYYNYYPYYYPYYDYGYYGYGYPYYDYGYYDYGYPDTYSYSRSISPAPVRIADNVLAQWLGPDDLRIVWTGDTKDVDRVEVAVLDSYKRTLRHSFSESPVFTVDVGVPGGAANVRIRTINTIGTVVSEIVCPLPGRY